MAKGIVESALALNPIEVQDFQQFIIEQVFTKPELLAVHGIQTGIKMKEQIVFASQFGKTGLKGDSNCDRKTSGAQSILTQKYWEPVGIEDTLIHCNAELDGLFKAYFGKINSYREKYDITGTDLEIFFSILFLESISNTLWRAVWFGDTAIAVADATTEGLVSAGDVKFYNYFNGFFKQIFAGVSATTIKRVTIAENAITSSKPAQLVLPAKAASAYFAQMATLASTALRSNPDAELLVSRELFDNYVNELIGAGGVYDINVIQNGLPTVSWRGYKIVNMETVWGREDFVNNTDDDVYYLPHRAVLTVPQNIPIGTLNQDDFTDIEIFYDQVSRKNYMAYGFSLDAKVLEDSMIVVAY